LRRVDREKALETLDHIEAVTSVAGKDGAAAEIGMPGVDGEALELVVNVARHKGGLKSLIERYGSSRSVIIVGALALVLVRRAERTKLKDAYLLFDLIEKLRRKDNPNILVTILTAIRHQIGLARVWQHTRTPESLYTFLQHCLAFPGVRANPKHRGLSDQVQAGAIDVLRIMCEAGIYDLNFDGGQRGWVEDKVKEIAKLNTRNAIFQTCTSSFLNCLRTTD
jgi:hypothetical protein